jgi:hypothetical protein
MATLQEQRIDLVGLTMAELGNQHLYDDLDRLLGHGPSAKAFFTAKGVHHVSFDWNGCYGALPLDLTRPIDEPRFREGFDVVTNFGTSEHVSPQHPCFVNIHDLCKPESLMIHEVPEEGHWPGHAPVHYTYGFFEALARACSYEVVQLSRNVYPVHGNLIYCVLRKAPGSLLPPPALFSRWDGSR